MSCILPAIHTLNQCLHHFEHHPEVYRPSRCPHCDRTGLWCHGDYFRKAEREAEEGIYLDPVPIPQFLCPHRRRTCSRLPSCIPPHRWYLWSFQLALLTLLLNGTCVRKAAKQVQPARRTLSRWWRWLQDHFSLHSFYLRSRFPGLGQKTGSRIILT